MPLNRYQIRNEYSLADPELYKVADKDDPEALLEGVAMAGLVGVLRQLGDLAEFAAEIFHDLHEEVMATASRGHGLIVRVQQLEAEFPSIERTLLSQTSHTSFLYNSGIDWHPNPRMDQSVVTHKDLPRFVMDSYEECRGPPRLFLLDKFDVAGAGACLKRFTDPSFFKTESTLLSGRKLEGQREKKTRRVKKRGLRGRNGDTPESFPSSHAKLHQLFLEERIESGINDPARRVKLKKRQFTGSLFNQDNVRSYMEKFLDTSPQEQKVLHEIYVDPLALTWTSDNACEAGLEIVEIGTVSPVKEPIQTDRSLCSSPDAGDMVVKPSLDDFYKDKNLTSDNDSIEVTGLNHESHDGSISTISKVVSGEETADRESKSEVSVNDAASEIDNYEDALANIESEIETDSECKENQHYMNLKPIVIDSDGSERNLKLQSISLDSQSIGNSLMSEDGDNFSKDKDISSCSVSVKTLNETVPDLDAAVMAAPTAQTYNSDLDNRSFDHFSTTEEIVRKERQHAAAYSIHAKEEDEQEFAEASNTSYLAESTKVDMPVDMEGSPKKTHFPDPKSKDSVKRFSILEDQEHTIQPGVLSSDVTYLEAYEDSGHSFSAQSNHEMEVGRHDNKLGMTDTTLCSNGESPNRHLSIFDPVYLEKTKLIDVACEKELYIPSIQENPKDLFCVSDSSTSPGIQEIPPGTTNSVNLCSPNFAAGNLPCLSQDPIIENNIAVHEERVSSALSVVEATTLPTISNQLHICAREVSSDTEAGEIAENGSLEADIDVVSSRLETSNNNSGLADENIVNGAVMVGKPSQILDLLETECQRLNFTSETTDATLSELSQDEDRRLNSRNITGTGCSVSVGGYEDEATLVAGLLERENVCKDTNLIHPNQSKVSEPDILVVVDGPASQAEIVRGEASSNHALSDQLSGLEKIFSHDASSLSIPFKHTIDSDYIMAAKNDFDLDHNEEKVKHMEMVADGPGQVDVKDDNGIDTMSSSLSLHPDKLHGAPDLVGEEFCHIDLVPDTCVKSAANLCSMSSDDSPLILHDDLLPEDVNSEKLDAKVPLASENEHDHVESIPTQLNDLLEVEHRKSVSHNPLTPQYVQKEQSDAICLHYDDQSAVSKASPQSGGQGLETSNAVFQVNGILNGANEASVVESSDQPLSTQGFPDLEVRPSEPRINLEPPSALPPLPPMQWRLGRFQNSSAAPMERQMLQHTLVPVQVQPVSMPTMHHNLASVQPMSLPSLHHTLASFQPVPLPTGNSLHPAVPSATLPTTLPAVHYTYTPVRPVTLPTSGYGIEGIGQTFTSEGLMGYSNGYMAQHGVLTLPMSGGVSDGFFQLNSSVAGRQENSLSTVPLTSTTLDGYVTQQGVYPLPMPAVVSEVSCQNNIKGLGREGNVPSMVSLASTRSLDGMKISEGPFQPNLVHSESESSIEGHFSKNTSKIEPKMNIESITQNMLGLDSQVLEEEAGKYRIHPLLSSTEEQPSSSLVAHEAGMTWLSAYDGILTRDADGTTNGTLQKKPPRPRNPLIDEVVAIDKSKLRKVERVKPQSESKPEEGESLLEQMQLRKVERSKLSAESKVERENLLEQLQLRKVEQRVKPPVEQKLEEKEFLLEQLQLRKVGVRIKPPSEPKSEEREFSLEQLQLRKVKEKSKKDVEPTVEETGSPQAYLRKVGVRFRQEVEAKAEETESPRVQLRKVSERAQLPVVEKTEERDSLFEQIRNKSFNLKPAVAARPNIQGPRTNLKVAAILEKASTIRQAMAGSDEEDDADSWSDDS
ncbi:uncharacterized protein LOC130814165 isoform X2 [Amaranthus tricolor]|uniref:uncharacterized protein LOC130814165 isoform X2 n=1 Tax=Amaranthus tricolor TaxID=29722 RepID=UPI00258D6C5B|nr:uncharacterized protein LOC130814165 isoform X2 [Amaranthus tricolor]